MTKLVIGLIGAKGAGKTSVFSMLKNLDASITETMLARHLKDVCGAVFNIPQTTFESLELKEKEMETPIYLRRKELLDVLTQFQLPTDEDHIRRHVGKIIHTPRALLQYIGTEVVRAVDPMIHCRRTKVNPDGVTVVTDIRFVNEAKFFEYNYPNFVLLYIKNMKAEHYAAKDMHPSERGLDDLKRTAAYTIDNAGTLEDLQRKVSDLYNTLKKRTV